MCDFVNIIPGHDCYSHNSPTQPIKDCEICNRKTCSWTRVATIYPLDYVACIQCSKIHMKWNEMIERNKEKNKIKCNHLKKITYNKISTSNYND